MLWQVGVEDRAAAFVEVIQTGILARFAKGGDPTTLVIEAPTFDDRAPAFELLAKATSAPLTNDERRDLIGLEPMEDAELGAMVMLPATLVPLEIVSEPEPVAPVPPVMSVPPPPMEPMDDMPPEMGKASVLQRARAAAERNLTPAIRRSVADVLRAQRDDVLRRVRAQAAHLMRRPDDADAWWAKDWDARLTSALRPRLTAVADLAAEAARDTLGQPKAGPEPGFLDRVREVVSKSGAERVTGINGTTRDTVMAEIRRVVTEAALAVDPVTGEPAALSIPQVADKLTETVGSLMAWDPARAEMIARTETMNAYNEAALTSYREYGVDRVEAIDGHDDPECAERNGRTYTLDEAMDIADHPNGTLDWLPVV